MARTGAAATTRTTKEGDMLNGIQAGADRLGLDRPAGRFGSRQTIDERLQVDVMLRQAIARAKEGDQEALRFLYLRYADNVFGYVSSLLRNEHDAEDVTQQVFAKLITSLHKYEERKVPFAAWILRVARNMAIDHLRQRRAVPCEEVRELDPREREETDYDRSATLMSALAMLPDDQREVVVLRHLVGLTPAEIAGRMGRTEPAVHGLHHRGRGALRSTLSESNCAPTVMAA
jgi:RNA polymerase sigma-70 factor (ECF subfamily)